MVNRTILEFVIDLYSFLLLFLPNLMTEAARFSWREADKEKQ